MMYMKYVRASMNSEEFSCWRSNKKTMQFLRNLLYLWQVQSDASKSLISKCQISENSDRYKQNHNNRAGDPHKPRKRFFPLKLIFCWQNLQEKIIVKIKRQKLHGKLDHILQFQIFLKLNFKNNISLYQLSIGRSIATEYLWSIVRFL